MNEQSFFFQNEKQSLVLIYFKIFHKRSTLTAIIKRSFLAGNICSENSHLSVRNLSEFNVFKFAVFFLTSLAATRSEWL